MIQELSVLEHEALQCGLSAWASHPGVAHGIESDIGVGRDVGGCLDVSRVVHVGLENVGNQRRS